MRRAVLVAGTHCSRQVMVVEDDPDVREALLEALELNDYEPVGATNGRDGIERLRAAKTKPCLILLDVMMPVLDGWGFRTLQIEAPDLKGIPVVVLTAGASAEQVAREMGAAGALKKPVLLDTLIQTVQRYC